VCGWRGDRDCQLFRLAWANLFVAGELLASGFVIRAAFVEDVVPIDLCDSGGVIVFDLCLVDKVVLRRILFTLQLGRE
jgi:hypothetical protein